MDENNKEMVKHQITIPKKEYDELLEDQNKLRALEAGGVDNWEFYDDAMESMEDE